MGAKSVGPGRKATHVDILRFIRRKDTPIVTAKDVKNEFGVSRAAANKWLDEMLAEGKIVSEKVGASAVVYWLPGD